MSPWDALWLYLFVGSVVALCVEVGSCEISGNRLLPLLALALILLWPWALWRGFKAAVGRRRR